MGVDLESDACTYTSVIWGVLQEQGEEGSVLVLTDVKVVLGPYRGDFPMPVNALSCVRASPLENPFGYALGRRYMVFLRKQTAGESRTSPSRVLRIIDLDQPLGDTEAIKQFRSMRPRIPSTSSGLDKWVASLDDRAKSNQLKVSEISQLLGEPESLERKTDDADQSFIEAVYLIRDDEYVKTEERAGDEVSRLFGKSVTRSCPRITVQYRDERVTSVAYDTYTVTTVSFPSGSHGLLRD